MRHVLILASALAVALSLTGCSRNTAQEEAPAAAVLPGLAEDAIEVTPLDGPSAAEAIGAEALAVTGAAGPAEGEAPALADPAGAEPVGAEPPVPVAEAGDETPHPAARPGETAAASDAPAEDSAAETAPPEPPKSQPQRLCEAAGGIWGEAAESGAFLCQKPTRDSGKSCDRKGDCQGECLARSGTCAPVIPLLGCNEVLDSEGRLVTLCIN